MLLGLTAPLGWWTLLLEYKKAVQHLPVLGVGLRGSSAEDLLLGFFRILLQGNAIPRILQTLPWKSRGQLLPKFAAIIGDGECWKEMGWKGRKCEWDLKAGGNSKEVFSGCAQSPPSCHQELRGLQTTRARLKRALKCEHLVNSSSWEQGGERHLQGWKRTELCVLSFWRGMGWRS